MFVSENALWLTLLLLSQGLLSGCGHVPNVFDPNPAVKLIPEVLDYGAAFVLDFMQTGCFARWMHACERNYCMIGDLILHPSGPPTDALDGTALWRLAFCTDVCLSAVGSSIGDL